jgi:hypothetical protein
MMWLFIPGPTKIEPWTNDYNPPLFGWSKTGSPQPLHSLESLKFSVEVVLVNPHWVCSKVNKLRSRLKNLPSNICIWIHLGEMPPIDITPDDIKNELSTFSLSHCVKQAVAYSLENPKPWDKIVKKVMQEFKKEKHFTFHDELDKAWRSAFDYYHVTAVRKHLCELLYPIYIEIERLLNGRETDNNYAEGLRKCLRGGTAEEVRDFAGYLNPSEKQEFQRIWRHLTSPAKRKSQIFLRQFKHWYERLQQEDKCSK